MTMRNMPLLTLLLLLTSLGLYGLAPDPSVLYFNAANIANGETWRVVTGHFMHADLEHLVWNCLGLGVLGMLIEIHSRTMLCISLVVGITSVSALLMLPNIHLNYYCGLSGVLNTLLVVAIWNEWLATRSWLILAVALGSLGKVLIELLIGDSVLTHISWPPYTWSHLAGLIGGLLIAGACRLRFFRPAMEHREETELTSHPL